jgi:hypothetical protein
VGSVFVRTRPATSCRLIDTLKGMQPRCLSPWRLSSREEILKDPSWQAENPRRAKLQGSILDRHGQALEPVKVFWGGTKPGGRGQSNRVDVGCLEASTFRTEETASG